METKPMDVIEHALMYQPTIIDQLKHALTNRQLSHAFLFVGPNGRGQNEVADWLAMRLLCRHPQSDGNPDGTCDQCQRIAQHEHPDVLEFEPEGKSLKIEQIRFLQNELTKTAVEGDQKVLIVHAAETMTASAANGLLKSIEEPQGNQTIILIATNRQQILPTIVSRTQVIDFNALAGEKREQQLLALGYSETNVPLVAALTDDVELAQAWLVDDWFDQARQAVERLMTALLRRDNQAFLYVQTALMPLIKVQQADPIIAMLIQASRDLLLAMQGGRTPSGFSALRDWQTLAQALSMTQLIELTDLALSMPKAIEMNLNVQTVLESFVIKSQKVIAG